MRDAFKIAFVRGGALLLCGACIVIFCKDVTVRKYYTPIVRQVAGDARMLGSDTSEEMQVKVGDMPLKGSVFTTGINGSLGVRFNPDFMRIEARANTRYQLAYSQSDSTVARRVTLMRGGLVFANSKHSPPLIVEDVHSSVSAGMARFSFAANSDASILIVLDGVVKLHDIANNEIATVQPGQKAVSDRNGVKINAASEAELQQVGRRQNTLEVDFVNPATKESGTLEMEYENNF